MMMINDLKARMLEREESPIEMFDLEGKASLCQNLIRLIDVLQALKTKGKFLLLDLRFFLHNKFALCSFEPHTDNRPYLFEELKRKKTYPLK